jgi:hypothetical protein
VNPPPQRSLSSPILGLAQFLAYLTVARIIVAVITGNPSAWSEALLWLVITGVAFVVVFLHRRWGQKMRRNPDARAMRIDNATIRLWRDRPTYAAARLAFWFCCFFAVTSTLGTIFLENRAWPAVVAYVTTALVAGSVVLIERRRGARVADAPVESRPSSD